MAREGHVSSLIRNLKGKKVVQWALGYLAGAFVALQLMDALEGPLGLSQRIQQSVVALLAMGLVVAVIVAWYHGEGGRQRVSLTEIMALGVALVIGLSATAVPWVAADAPEVPNAPGESSTESLSVGPPESGTSAITEMGDREDVPVAEAASASVEPTPTPIGSAGTAPSPAPAMGPENPTIYVGDSVRLNIDTDRPVLWASIDRSIARVMSDGLVLGVRSGATRIVATVDGSDVSTRVRVQAVPVSQVDVAPIGTMRVGESASPRLVVRLENGQTRTEAETTWTSSDAAVVRVGRAGGLSAVAPGSARVSAEVDGVVGSIDVIVEALVVLVEDEVGAETTETQAPPVSPEVLFAVVERYRAALDSRNIAEVVAVYPGISAEERAGWDTIFGIGDITAEFRDLTVREADSVRALVEFEQILTGDRIERNATRFIAALVSLDGVWRIDELRSLASVR
jgi:hypothetical protein